MSILSGVLFILHIPGEKRKAFGVDPIGFCVMQLEKLFLKMSMKMCLRIVILKCESKYRGKDLSHARSTIL